jgi:hypothetical protein
MDNDTIRRFAELTDAIRKHEDDIDALKAERAELEATLLEQYRTDGVQRVTLGNRTVWIDRKIWASVGGPELIPALKEVGLEAFCKETVNAQTLSGWVREADPDGALGPDEIIAKLPEPVRPYIKISEVYRLMVRKA